MLKNDLRSTIGSWVDQRIHDILTSPRMWGESLEAIELQVLTLLQVRALAADPERELRNPRRSLDQYVTTLATRFGVQPAQPVFQAFGGDEDQFIAVLARLVSILKEPLTTPNDTFFAHSYLGIELTFKPGQSPNAQSVTSFYEDFRRATRSLARFGSSRTGRVEKSIESETDFELEGVEVTPHNGVPASARLILGAPYGQHDLVSREKVKDALGQMLELGERADSAKEIPLETFGGSLDFDARTRAFVQTMRILPRGRIAEVKIGGTFVSRETPVRLSENHEALLVSAMAQHLEPAPYDQTALIRAIDLDRGSFSHGNRPSGRVQCYWHSDQVKNQLSRVGVLARVIGMQYRPRNGQPFVMAETVDVISNRLSRDSQPNQRTR